MQYNWHLKPKECLAYIKLVTLLLSMKFLLFIKIKTEQMKNILFLLSRGRKEAKVYNLVKLYKPHLVL